MIGIPFKASSCLGRSAFMRRPKPAAAMIAPTFIRKEQFGLAENPGEAIRILKFKNSGCFPPNFNAKLPFGLAVPVHVLGADRNGCSVPDDLRALDDATFRVAFPRSGRRSSFRQSSAARW